MIELKEKQILIDGKPTLLMAGEIHYFRLKKEEWEDRIIKAKEAGCNVIASYVPWLIHEHVEGEIDLTGENIPENDLASFIDLCAKYDLFFFVRPGPFVMAELKNEGIPYWLYEDYPQVSTITWDSEKGHHATVNYLDEIYLSKVKKWYQAVGEIVAPRTQPNGGNVVGYQLDNEVGMLQWVTNTPDLSDSTVSDFWEWMKQRYTEDKFLSIYGFPLEQAEQSAAFVRTPEESYTLELLRDLGHFFRNRFKIYIQILKEFAKESGVQEVLFVVNIHGTSGDRAHSYPIGISQLYESYWEDPELLPGSDMYLGNINYLTIPDLYLANILMDAVQHEDQPLSAIEFNCGDGNFGDNMGGRIDVSAADLKTRLFVAQGNKMINYYLIAGGRNPEYDWLPKDGNQRIATTGERHGFAAPINPEGKLSYTYPRMAESIHKVLESEKQLAVMQPEYDSIAFAFIPDYFMTEYHYPGSEKSRKFIQNLTQYRTGTAWDFLVKGMLFNHFRFPAIDIQNKEIDPQKITTLVVPSARYMSKKLQHKLVDYVKKGGNILFYGELPLYDMLGKSCTHVIDTLQVAYQSDMNDGPEKYLSYEGRNKLEQIPESRTNYTQLFKANKEDTILVEKHSRLACGVLKRIEKGKVMAITCHLSGKPELVRSLLELLDTTPAFQTSDEAEGLFLATTSASKAGRLLHVINLEGYDKTIQIKEKGKLINRGERLTIPAYQGIILSLD